MRQIKLRAPQPQPPERNVRLRINGRLAADLDDYRALYARTHGTEIELPALIEGILAHFLETDRGFSRGKRGSEPVGQAPTRGDTESRP